MAESVINVKHCCGCGACEAVCPRDAVSIGTDREGFHRSSVDADRCIKCGRCTQVCPEYKKAVRSGADHVQTYYAVRSTDPDILNRSSSGGLFTELAKSILMLDGIVYGVSMDGTSGPLYGRAATKEEVAAFLGSKYFQAYLPSDLISSFIDDVRSGMPVLFSGTACVIAALKNLLEHEQILDGNVIWADFLCSGVVSPLLLEKEIKHKEKSRGIHVSGVSFRDKSTGWRDYSIRWFTDDSSISERFVGSNIGEMLSQDNAKMRKCSHCEYRSFERVSDITMGDFWNDWALPRRFCDDKGVSLMMINSGKGQRLFDKITTLDSVEVEKRFADSHVLHPSHSQDDPSGRDEYWNEALDDYELFCRKQLRIGLKTGAALKIRTIMIKTGLYRFFQRVKAHSGR